MHFVTSPNAYFDLLMLAELVQNTTGPLYPEELHLLGYLACVLELYRSRQPTSLWGYDFAGTSEGRPHSPVLHASIQDLVQQGHLRELESGALTLSEEGKRELEIWKTLETFRVRLPSLEAASKSTLPLPLESIRQAISSQDSLKSAANLQDSQLLLGQTETEAIYEQFDAISTAVGVDIREIMIPGVIWLKYLLRSAQVSERGF